MLDGAVFASSRENGPPVTFLLTQENVIQGFIDAISTMQPGDKSVFTIAPEFAVTKSGCPASIPWNIPPNQTLRFDVELISLITDVLQDQCILKKTIKLGSEDKDHPGDLDEVFVKYTACLKDGTLVSTSEGVEVSLAEGLFCPAFAHALKTMKEGEGALLIVKPKYGFGEQGRPAMGNEAPVPPDATLHVNLQLMSWITVSRIGENQEILKKVLHQDQTKPLYSIRWKIMNQAVVKVRLIGKLEDGTVFDRRGHDGDEPFEFTIDEEHVMHSLDEAVLTMEEGEVASFTIPPQHAFGTGGSDQFQLAVVPANSVVIYEIELLSIVHNPLPLENPLPLTLSNGAAFAQCKIKEGDNLFNLKKYMRAYRRYYMASQVLQPHVRKTDCKIKPFVIYCLNKSALCAIRVQRYEQAVDRYREVLEYDPGNAMVQQEMAKYFQKASVGIDTVAMHMGLKFYTREEVMDFPSGAPAMSVSKKHEPVLGAPAMSVSKKHEPVASTTIYVPPVARPAEDESQPVDPAAPAASAYQSPAPSAMPVALGGNHDRATPSSENQASSWSLIKALPRASGHMLIEAVRDAYNMLLRKTRSGPYGDL